MDNLISPKLVTRIFSIKVHEYEAKNALDPAGSPKIFSKDTIQNILTDTMNEINKAFMSKQIDKLKLNYGLPIVTKVKTIV